MKVFGLTALCALGVCVSAADVHYANPLNQADEGCGCSGNHAVMAAPQKAQAKA